MFNTSDTSITHHFTTGDLNGILFYVHNNNTDKLQTLVYKKQAGSADLIFDDYLSTNVNYISTTHIELLSKVLSDGADDHLKLFIVRDNEGYLSDMNNNYSEFYNRILYTGKNNSVNVSGAPNCGGICMVEVENTYCIWGEPHPFCSTEPEGGGACYYQQGFQTATPISHSISDCNGTLEPQRQFRDNVLLKSKKA